MPSTLSLEEQAIAEWLESDVPIEKFVERRPDLRNGIKDYFNRFVDAAEAYHNDQTNELTLRGAAFSKGLPLWVFEYFLTKFSIDREPGKEGRMQVENLKRHQLYSRS